MPAGSPEHLGILERGNDRRRAEFYPLVANPGYPVPCRRDPPPLYSAVVAHYPLPPRISFALPDHR